MRADASTMRIFLTCNYSPWSAYSGGGQRSTHYLGSALSGRGHDVTVVFTKTPWDRVEPPPSLPYRLRWAVLPDYKSHIGAPLRVLTAWTVAGVIRRELAPDETAVVHAQGEEAARLPRERASASRKRAFSSLNGSPGIALTKSAGATISGGK